MCLPLSFDSARLYTKTVTFKKQSEDKARDHVSALCKTGLCNYTSQCIFKHRYVKCIYRDEVKEQRKRNRKEEKKNSKRQKKCHFVMLINKKNDSDNNFLLEI